MEAKNQSPKWPVRLLRHLVKSDFQEEIEGDLEERFQDNLERYNLKKAKRLFILDALKLIRPKLLKKPGGDLHLNSFGMLQHHFKIVVRQTLNQKVFSTIKIGGFAVGIAACILITLYVDNQTGFDRHYQNKDRIYRIANQWSESGETGYWTNIHGPLKKLFEQNIPEIEKVARVVRWSWGDAGENQVRRPGESYNHFEEGFIYADPELLEILEIPMIYGNRDQALSTPKSIVISKRKAETYFPNQNPVGKQIILNDDPESTFTIGGVMEGFPDHSHLQGDFIMTLFERKKGPGTSGWCCTNYHMYVLLTPQADKLLVEQKTVDLRNLYVLDKLKKAGSSGLEEMKKYQSYYLQPVENIYLNPEQVWDDASHGSIELLWVFSFIAIIILLQACMNFINLSTANAAKRAKEVGLRKVVGSFKSNLIYQYLSESCLYTFLAIGLGLLLAQVTLPFFNHLANTSIFIPWLSLWFIPSLLLTALSIGLLSGIYPAFYLSGFRPVEVLKGKISTNGKTSTLRSGMIVIQFTVTIILIVAALTTHKQFQFIMGKSLGYEKEQVITIQGLETMNTSEKKVFKSELKKLLEVSHATISDYFPVEGSSTQNRAFWITERRHLDNGFEAAYWWVDEDYIQTMGIKLLKGRAFNGTTSDDNAVIINETMAETLITGSPIGQSVTDMFDKKYTVIGVVKDFHFESLLSEVRPLAMVQGTDAGTIHARLEVKDIGIALGAVQSVWDKLQPNQSMRHHFMDQRFERMYDELNRAKTIFILFSVLSIVIACSGLFALSLYLIGQRGKEISIRKVLGADIGKIYWLLSYDFIKLVFIAILIAVPVARYLMGFLIEDFISRIELSWNIFVTAGFAALAVTLSTISYEILKTALANPAKQLRSE